MRFQVRLISGMGIGVVMDVPRYLVNCKTLGEAKERAEAMYPQACRHMAERTRTCLIIG